MVLKKVDNLGRIVLPINIRRALGIKKDDALRVECINDSIVIRVNKKICKLCGSIDVVDGRTSVCSECISKIKHGNFII